VSDDRPGRSEHPDDSQNGRLTHQPLPASVFAAMDQMPDHMHTMLLGTLEGMTTHAEIRRVRRIAHDAQRPAPGQRLLDAGYGLGEVARSLAADVGPTGEVLAHDPSVATVAAAASRHDGSPSGMSRVISPPLTCRTPRSTGPGPSGFCNTSPTRTRSLPSWSG
jgi:hypothetical protein